MTERVTGTIELTIATSLGSCTTWEYGSFAGGELIVQAGTDRNDLTSIAWYSCDTREGTFLPCYKQDGTTAVTTTVNQERAIKVPDEVFGCKYLRGLGTFDNAKTSCTIKAVGKS